MCHYVEGNASQMPPAIMCLRPKPSLWMIQRSSCSRRAKVRTRTGQRGSGFTPEMGALGPEQRRPLYGISSPPAEARNIPLNIWKPTRALPKRMPMFGIMTHTEQVACACQVIHGPWALNTSAHSPKMILPCQLLAYCHAFYNFGSAYRWMGFIDIDEHWGPQTETFERLKMKLAAKC